ncbi:hypothetical protein SKAU_G00042910 [Synaphobranchus kaupii]|uniref:Uncharacterized protein n=1 Tax=Synaphobranchus kaupii TaxID=118154 RepID=A0A9Q1J7X3_SYNKA|nr:hypothetical protein SKAU_G00042910 [Synaphobranchus kaupii]
MVCHYGCVSIARLRPIVATSSVGQSFVERKAGLAFEQQLKWDSLRRIHVYVTEFPPTTSSDLNNQHDPDEAKTKAATVLRVPGTAMRAGRGARSRAGPVPDSIPAQICPSAGEKCLSDRRRWV